MKDPIDMIKSRMEHPAFEEMLAQRLPYFTGVEKITALKGGRSNPNFRIDTPSHSYVLRSQPPGILKKSAHNMGREYKVVSALQDSAIPVPSTYFLHEDPDLLGVSFYVMDFVDGAIHRSFYLEGLEEEDRKDIYINMVRLLANLHEVDFRKLGLQKFGSGGNYFERQYHRWKHAFPESMEGGDRFAELTDWLGKQLPQDSARTIIHGDFRLDNIVFSESDKSVQALLDWELSTLGDPLSDLGYFLGILETPPDFYLPGFGQKDRSKWGIPEEAELLDIYCETRGLDRIDNWVFYKAFGFFRLAAICAGVMQRANTGNAVDENSHLFGDMARQLTDMALRYRH